MTVSKNYAYISPEDYLEGERVSPIKHEYIRGEVYAMTGGTQAHNIITGNLFLLLGNHVRHRGCRAFMENIKVRIETADIYYYPDLVVSCDSRDRNSYEDFIRYPSLVVEVLSPTTAAFDRGDKFGDYRQIETLQEYVLISQERVSVECFRRNTEGRWELYTYTKGEEIYLASVDFRTDIAVLYEDVPELS